MFPAGTLFIGVKSWNMVFHWYVPSPVSLPGKSYILVLEKLREDKYTVFSEGKIFAADMKSCYFAGIIMRAQ